MKKKRNIQFSRRLVSAHRDSINLSQSKLTSPRRPPAAPPANIALLKSFAALDRSLPPPPPAPTAVVGDAGCAVDGSLLPPYCEGAGRLPPPPKSPDDAVGIGRGDASAAAVWYLSKKDTGTAVDAAAPPTDDPAADGSSRRPAGEEWKSS
jgi:hypothetical protein